MKKISLLFLLSLIIVLGAISYVCAEEGIVETPNVKIVIDGELTTYTDVPLSLNQRTLLPLREVLTNLGVPNDDEHIVWNGDEKSVTDYKDDLKVYLKIGSNTVYVNEQPVEMDVAPIGYINQRVYIPARFVSEALGKVVVWDGSAKAVLIRDEEEFNRARDILEKCDFAMESISKSRFDVDLAANMSQHGFSMNIGMKMSGQVDKVNKDLYMLASLNMLGMDMRFGTYLVDNVMYSENPMTGEWGKTSMAQQEYDDMFDSNSSSMDIFDAIDALSAGLVIQESDDPDEILLKGNVYLDELFSQVNKQVSGKKDYESVSSNYNLNQFYAELSIDSNTHLLNALRVNVKGSVSEDEAVPMDMSIEVVYTDYDGDFEIVVPQEVIDNAVEVQNSYIEV